MAFTFYKFQGTGNDFIMIDNRDGRFPKHDAERVTRLCDRRFGIGADGLILLEAEEGFDFGMVYFNSDGKEGSMCGNGGRCIVAFARQLGIVADKAYFMAVDGPHTATIKDGLISLQMKDVSEISTKPNAMFMDTGSPHHVQLVKDLDRFEVATEGKKLRYGLYGEKGSNINFVVQEGPDTFSVRTYERGVEDETLSCGTGVTAVAIAMYDSGRTSSNNVIVRVLGGELQVTFQKIGETYREVHLTGPALLVFKGEITCCD